MHGKGTQSGSTAAARVEVVTPVRDRTEILRYVMVQYEYTEKPVSGTDGADSNYV